FRRGMDNNEPITIKQEINISALSEKINSQKVNFTLGGLFGGLDSGTADLTAVFKDLNGKELGKFSTDKVTASDRHDEVNILPRQKSGAVPVNTSSVELQLKFFSIDGCDNCSSV